LKLGTEFFDSISIMPGVVTVPAMSGVVSTTSSPAAVDVMTAPEMAILGGGLTRLFNDDILNFLEFC